MKKVLFVAHVVKRHFMLFHIPYLKWFKENGYETHVCARNDYEKKEDCNIPYCDKYYDLPFERSPFNSSNIVAYKQLKKIIDSNEYDIIHCHTPVGGVLTRLAARKARKNGTKVIYTAHGFHFFKGAPLTNWMLFYPVEKFCARYTDVLITINQEDYNIAQKFKANKVVYVPGVGVDTKKFCGLNIDRREKRKELGISDNQIALISVGELSKRKNHEVIIRALAKLNNPNTIYFICGQGVLDEYLKDRAKELKVDVRFLGFRKDVFEIFAATDLFVFPSLQEGLPVALMEAMSIGLSVVCSKIRGNTDLIADGKGGYLVESDDVEGFVKAIYKLADNAELREEIGKHNQEVVKDFDIENVNKIMCEIYKRA
ncbi:glycosyltransferase family 1 protein [Clostridium estertheticum]|uniref:Glycosyltransferase family 1 protein n=1 Tax=Clostridium estertheticum TaxID=238834 RepID=A0A5N7J5D3_9CLOT|nr:glycosyltransferase family 4 protein [Clostridium estertheticum]MPQ33289.1 glycosyltransferase family 1 protein [Clostridium estertheticum]MPQ63947.1 glycosyltransferase family 1 protein [Clostridium estertheticum]